MVSFFTKALQAFSLWKDAIVDGLNLPENSVLFLNLRMNMHCSRRRSLTLCTNLPEGMTNQSISQVPHSAQHWTVVGTGPSEHAVSLIPLTSIEASILEESHSDARYYWWNKEMCIMYSWPLENGGVKGANTLHNQKSMYYFRLPQNLTTNNSVLLSRSLISNINSLLTHIT